MFGTWEKALKGVEGLANEIAGGIENEIDSTDYVMRGFASSTRIATERGWRRITDIKAGDRVFTFDNGLQTVMAVSRGTHFVASDSMPNFTNPIHVPIQAIGNEEPMVLLPEQVVMIESDVAEELTGDPFALIPAKLLVGFRGIERFRSLHAIEMATIHFEHDEIVYADGGALMLSPAAIAGFALLDFVGGNALPAPYEVWKGDRARALIAGMVEKDREAQIGSQINSAA